MAPVEPKAEKADVLQVFTFGHPLSQESKDFLRSLGKPLVIYSSLLHYPQNKDVVRCAQDVVEDLLKQGADLSGETDYVMAAPGSSLGVVVMVAALTGGSGSMPKVLNLMRPQSGNGPYVPCPELPLIDAHALKNSMRAFIRRIEMNREREVVV